MRDAAERGDLGAQKAVGRLYPTGLEEMDSDPREAENGCPLLPGAAIQKRQHYSSKPTAARKDEDAAYKLKTRW